MANWEEGVEAFRAGDYRGAAAAFEASVERSPEAPQGHYMLGLSLIQARRQAAALGPLGRAVELDGSQVEYRLALSQAQLQGSLPDDALMTLERLDPAAVPEGQRAAYQRLLARAAGESDLLKIADGALDLALKADEASKPLWLARAKLLEKIGDPEGAYAAEARAYALDSGDEALGRRVVQRAIRLARSREGEERIAWYVQGAEVGSSLAKAVPTPASWRLAGEALMGARDYAAAGEFFSRIAEEEPDDPIAPFYLGRCAQGREEPEAALAFLARAKEMRPDADLLPQIHLARGQALRQLERFEEAAVAYRDGGHGALAEEMEGLAQAQAGNEEWERRRVECLAKKAEIEKIFASSQGLEGTSAWEEMQREAKRGMASCEAYLQG